MCLYQLGLGLATTQGDSASVCLPPEMFVKLARGSLALLTLAHGSTPSLPFLPPDDHATPVIIAMLQCSTILKIASQIPHTTKISPRENFHQFRQWTSMANFFWQIFSPTVDFDMLNFLLAYN